MAFAKSGSTIRSLITSVPPRAGHGLGLGVWPLPARRPPYATGYARHGACAEDRRRMAADSRQGSSFLAILVVAEIESPCNDAYGQPLNRQEKIWCVLPGVAV